MHSPLVSVLVLFIASSALADPRRAYSYYATIADPNTATGLEGRVNEVNEWFKSSPEEWFSTELGPIHDNKAAWRQIGNDSTEILFEYNSTVPSPILNISLSGGSYAEYDFVMSFSYPAAPARRNIAAREFWDNATDFQPVLFNNTARTITASTDACSANVSVSVVDAAGTTGNVTAANWVQYNVPTDAVFPLSVILSSSGNGDATAVLSDILGITYTTGPNGPTLATTSDFRAVFCLSDRDRK
ncbi:hypothetical protein C8F04DRAFT_25354 [Mycena alexandri]|uniref:Uncharacterized protein n=1 Tax=Mycena alexandri TaxID=1745969 RepID=A0AAD6XF99_9AGAR|nr:hypothetical protein C8F04DRAFT_25354 [Mycena alexandri]